MRNIQKNLFKQLRRTHIPPSSYKNARQPLVRFNLQNADKKIPVTIKLYENIVPETAENFRLLCEGTTNQNGEDLTYNGTKVVKAVPGVMIEAGHVNIPGGETIYGKDMPQESFDTTFAKEGLVAMCNTRAHHNGSAFFITLADYSHLDRKAVVVGEVVEGLDQIAELSLFGAGIEARGFEIAEAEAL